MIPLRDNIPARTTPFVNYAMIGLCGLAFLTQLGEGDHRGGLVEKFGMIPKRVWHPNAQIMLPEVVQTPQGPAIRENAYPAAPSPINPWLTLLTCIFLHGGWMHFVGNMWFLFIFGDNVEDRFGHVGYVLFYLGCGVAASATHLFTNASSPIPTIGASGAIAGVMGAYFLLYPKAKVVSIIPIVVYLEIVVLPAPVFLGIWFLLQFVLGTMSITGGVSGGVAWWAHIGGFAAGAAVAALLRSTGYASPPVDRIRPHTEHVGMHRYHRGE